jgi:hypothetical protein
MNAHTSTHPAEAEDFLADLTDAVYRVALRHGFKGSFLEFELELWSALRAAYDRHQPHEVRAGLAHVGERALEGGDDAASDARRTQRRRGVNGG